MPEEQVAIRKPRFSLRFKLSIGLILMISIVFAGLNAFNVLTHRKSLQDESIINRETVGRVVVAALTGQLADNDIDSARIRTFLKNFLTVALTQNKKNRDLAFAVVVDSDNRVIAGSAKPRLVNFPGDRRLTSEEQVLDEIAKRGGKLGRYMRTTRFSIRVPGKGEVGKLMVGTSLERLESEVRRDLFVNLAVFVATLLLLVIYSSLMLGHLVITPLSRIVRAMRHVQQGELDDEVQIARKDEMGILAQTYNFMVRGLREREQLKDAFSRYVSSQVYEKLQQGEITLTGETRNATVLFSDIRSFTNLSEQLTPADVVAMLNEYFTEMVEIVFKYEGFVNKFIGDAIMAVYNVPIGQDRPELRAVMTALDMIRALNELNRRRAERGQFAIKIGIGINTGPVVAGNIGHMRRLEYTVIGDTVNLAQRIESQTKVTGTPVLVSQTTYDAVAQYVVAEALPPVKVKGKQEPVALFAIKGLRQPAAAPAPAAPQQAPVA